METKLIKSFKVQRARYPAFCFPNIYNAVELTKKKFFDEIGCKLNYVAFLLRNNKRSYILGNLEDINNIRDSFLSKIIANKNFRADCNIRCFRKPMKKLSIPLIPSTLAS